MNRLQFLTSHKITAVLLLLLAVIIIITNHKFLERLKIAIFFCLRMLFHTEKDINPSILHSVLYQSKVFML